MLASPSDMNDLTPRQRRILEYIRNTARERGYPPTVREIGEAVGLTSSSSVHAQMRNLEKMGLLRKDAARPRAIEVTGSRRASATAVPLVGRIAAGSPVLADEQVEEYLSVPTAFAKDEDHFALRVQGDSMVGAGILDGDIVVVRPQDQAKDGDIVAALVPGPAEDEATVKRFKQRSGRVTLVPENPKMEPIDMPKDGRILGQVVAVMRKV